MSDPKCHSSFLRQVGDARAFVLSESDSTRFSAISRAIPDISPKVLTDTLKSLERDGLISRKLYAEIPPRVEYSLTELGRSLMPHLAALTGWAIENFDAVMKRR